MYAAQQWGCFSVFDWHALSKRPSYTSALRELCRWSNGITALCDYTASVLSTSNRRYFLCNFPWTEVSRLWEFDSSGASGRSSLYHSNIVSRCWEQWLDVPRVCSTWCRSGQQCHLKRFAASREQRHLVFAMELRRVYLSGTQQHPCSVPVSTVRSFHHFHEDRSWSACECTSILLLSAPILMIFSFFFLNLASL